MYPYNLDGKNRIQYNLANLVIKTSSMIQNHPPITPVELELSGLMHDIRYHIELVSIFHPPDDYLKKCMAEFNMNESAASIFVSRADRNIRKSFVTLTLFSLETILKIIATEHKISIPENNVISKYVIVMKYFDVYSEDNENLIKILHYTRNTLHNGDRVNKKSHISYNGKIFDFIPRQQENHKENRSLESTRWDYLTYFFQQLLDIFYEITKSQKYSVK